jgi:hypothetical protein
MGVGDEQVDFVTKISCRLTGLVSVMSVDALSFIGERPYPN